MSERKQEVDDAAFGARVFYFVFHFLGIMIMLIYDCDINQDLKNFKLVYPFFLLCIFLISAYLFMTCGQNPGYAECSPTPSFKSFSESQDSDSNIDERDNQVKEIILQPLNDCKNKNSNQFENDQDQGMNNFDIELQDKGQIKMELINNSDKKDNNMDQQSSTYVDEKSKKNKSTKKDQKFSKDNEDYEENSEPDFVAKKFFCPKCNLRQKYRTKHCDLCGRCINKFDHHCFWIGGCVGELNHRTFWAFLFFQCIFVACAFKTFWYGMDNYSHKDDITGEFKHDNAYGAFAVFAFISLCFIFFTGILCIYHAFLIITNQSTWEHASRDKITYTQVYPKGFYPFDEGIINNIKTVFCHNGQLQEWKLPKLKDAQIKAQNSFNICENEYYSCC